MNHSSFRQPPDGSISIWRYLDSFKFDWLVTYGRLYMPNCLDLGEDKLEGTLPHADVAKLNEQIVNAESEADAQVAINNHRLRTGFANKFQTHYYVSCWHMNQTENAEMWKRYTTSNASVAIRTTYNTLRRCLPDYVYTGCVSYIDFEADGLPSSNLLECITHKRLKYAFENEIRAVVLAPPQEVQWASSFYTDLCEVIAKPGQLVYAPPISITNLIEEVVVHFDAPLDLVDSINDACAAHSLPAPTISKLQF